MKNKIFVYLFILLAIIYLVLIIALPADPSVLKRYDITQAHARLINLTVAIPLVLIWLTALYGFIRFRAYALLIGDSPEGSPLNQLANGLMVLAFSLPVTSVLSSLLSYLTLHHHSMLPTDTIIRNYVGLLFSLGAFILISKGSRGLLTTFKQGSARMLSLPDSTVPVLIVLSSVFTWFIITRPISGQAVKNSYYLPDWLIIFTIAIPYLFAWYHGMLAAYRLYLYRTKVKGIIYKQAFESSAKGIGVIVLVSILIQFITTLSGRLTKLHLTPILLLIYLLVILYAVGFGLVARGTKKLKKIEEV